MRLPKALRGAARKAAATLPSIEPWPSRTKAMQAVMAMAWQYGLRSGLLVGLPIGVLVTLIALWVLV